MHDENTRFATVSWTGNDVLSMAEKMSIPVTEEQAVEFLERNYKQIQEDMVERGWSSIETLLQHERNEGGDLKSDSTAPD